MRSNEPRQVSTPTVRRVVLAGKCTPSKQQAVITTRRIRRQVNPSKSARRSRDVLNLQASPSHQSNTLSSRGAAVRSKSTQQVSTPPLQRASFEGKSISQGGTQSSRGDAGEAKSAPAKSASHPCDVHPLKASPPVKGTRSRFEASQLRTNRPRPGQHATRATCCTCRQVHPNRATRRYHEAPQLKSSRSKPVSGRHCDVS